MVADPHKEPRLERLMEDDFKRGLMSLPRGALRSQILRASPGLDEARLDEALSRVERLKERDPLAVLQEQSYVGGKKGGQFNLVKLARISRWHCTWPRQRDPASSPTASFGGRKSGKLPESYIPASRPLRAHRKFRICVPAECRGHCGVCL